MQICTNERKPARPAHAAGAFKGKIVVGATPKVQRDPFRRKHGFDLLMAQGSLIGIAAVKDTGEVHKEYNVLKKGSVQIQLPHDLIINRHVSHAPADKWRNQFQG